MKATAILVLLIATLSFASCSSMRNLLSNNTSSAATTSGRACGAVLANIYSGYKATGKVDVTNTTTVLSLVELGTYYSALKDNQNNASYIKDFSTGLVAGSSGLVMDSNVSAIINSLMSLNGFSTSAMTGIASDLINLFGNFTK